LHRRGCIRTLRYGTTIHGKVTGRADLFIVPRNILLCRAREGVVRRCPDDS
jgi:hypothetical protein